MFKLSNKIRKRIKLPPNNPVIESNDPYDRIGSVVATYYCPSCKAETGHIYYGDKVVSCNDCGKVHWSDNK